MEILNTDIIEAVLTITWYNGEREFLKKLLTLCQDKPKILQKDMGEDLVQWHTEKHILWMVLATKYGEWGTSIRGSWIDKPEELLRDFLQAADSEDKLYYLGLGEDK